jgi:hypothetical protein
MPDFDWDFILNISSKLSLMLKSTQENIYADLIFNISSKFSKKMLSFAEKWDFLSCTVFEPSSMHA